MAPMKGFPSCPPGAKSDGHTSTRPFHPHRATDTPLEPEPLAINSALLAEKRK